MWRAHRAAMNQRFQAVLSVVLVSVAAMFVGCSEAVDEVTSTVKCADVCGRYKDCFDSDFDVDGCTDRCEDDADASENREQRLEACDSCIDDKSCTDATFNCASQCAGIVP
jgi:hypothetical protein